MLQVRRLDAADAAAFRRVRLNGLRLHPEAFGASWEEEASRPIERTAQALADGHVAGCEQDGVLVGVAGLRKGSSLKTRHRGMVWGMYVEPVARGLGVGERLMASIIETARADLEALTLTVTAQNAAALALYGKLGFVEYGRDRRALKIGDDYVDECLMRLDLGPAPSRR